MSPDALPPIRAAVVRALGRPGRRPLVVGIAGAQGSGKSTVAAALVAGVIAEGLAAATLSIDDLYLSRADRVELARQVHLLFATRGVPGTHDLPLAARTLATIDAGLPVRLPRFDKAVDDRAPEAEWPRIDRALDLLVIEGWCVGAVAQGTAALAEPVNALERDEDPTGRWRCHADAALARDYPALFGRVDLLVLLAAPDFAVVRDWRREQEAACALASGAARG